MSEPLQTAEYLALEEQSSAELVCEVTRLMKEGWRPQGGMAIASNTFSDRELELIRTNFSFHQAMIRP
jgi:hypothetical protein